MVVSLQLMSICARNWSSSYWNYELRRISIEKLLVQCIPIDNITFTLHIEYESNLVKIRVIYELPVNGTKIYAFKELQLNRSASIDVCNMFTIAHTHTSKHLIQQIFVTIFCDHSIHCLQWQLRMWFSPYVNACLEFNYYPCKEANFNCVIWLSFGYMWKICTSVYIGWTIELTLWAESVVELTRAEPSRAHGTAWEWKCVEQ